MVLPAMSASPLVREWADGQVVPGTSYRVVRFIGAGGMGCVYEVDHVELGRPYVLKSLLASLASREDLIARMRTEWRALGRLRHPNIVDIVHAARTEQGVPYFVMERLVGETLAQRMRRRPALSIAEATRIAAQMLRGLHAAHEIGIVHRDVKPANVFLTADGGVKVLDFGVAKVVQDDPAVQTTARGTAIGTPRYMSPEQVAGQVVSPQSDLYAVGLVLYEMIMGQGPFAHAPDPAALMLAHLHERAPRLSARAPVAHEVDDVVASALEKAPSDRPASAAAMAAVLVGPERSVPPRAVSHDPDRTVLFDAPAHESTTKPGDGVVPPEAVPTLFVTAPTVTDPHAAGTQSPPTLAFSGPGSTPSDDAPTHTVARAPTPPQGRPVEASPAVSALRSDAGRPLWLAAATMGALAVLSVTGVLATRVLHRPPAPTPVAAPSEAPPPMPREALETPPSSAVMAPALAPPAAEAPPVPPAPSSAAAPPAPRPSPPVLRPIRAIGAASCCSATPVTPRNSPVSPPPRVLPGSGL